MFDQLHSSVDEKEIMMKQVHSKKVRIATIAIAAALVLALSVGAVAITSNGRLQDTLLRRPETPPTEIAQNEKDEAVPQPATTEEAGVPEQSVSYDPIPEDIDVISLQGFAGSPEHQAAAEWAEFEHGYDRDGTILHSVGNAPTEWDEKYNYNGYSVYSQEMADKMDEIAERYGLGLHYGGVAVADDLRVLFGDFSRDGNAVGYYYGDGTFQYDGDANGMMYQFRRTMKGVLDTVYLNVTDWTEYNQWEYETDCGVTVLLALGPQKALILAELDDCFVSVNVLAGTEGSMFGGEAITREELEAFADTFDLSVL
jgi:hypothetical protein